MSYVIRRLRAFPLVLIGVSIIVFIAIRLVPGDSITAMLGTEAGLLTPPQRDSGRRIPKRTTVVAITKAVATAQIQ